MPVGKCVEPSSTSGFPETPESKRRLKNLIEISGLSDDLDVISEAKRVSQQDLFAVHTKDYIKKCANKGIQFINISFTCFSLHS